MVGSDFVNGGCVRAGVAARAVCALLLSCALGSSAALAQGSSTESGTLRIISAGQAGGGGKSFGGSFSLEGSIGQTVAAPMNGGDFLVRSGFIPMCPNDCDLGDIDCDGSVSGSDLGILLLLFGPCPDPYSCVGDLDNSGEVDGGDLGLMLIEWH